MRWGICYMEAFCLTSLMYGSIVDTQCTCNFQALKMQTVSLHTPVSYKKCTHANVKSMLIITQISKFRTHYVCVLRQKIGFIIMCKISIEHYKVSCYICCINVNISKKEKKGKLEKCKLKPLGRAIWNLWVIWNYLFFPKRTRNHLNTHSCIDKNLLLVSAFCIVWYQLKHHCQNILHTCL